MQEDKLANCSRGEKLDILEINKNSPESHLGEPNALPKNQMNEIMCIAKENENRISYLTIADILSDKRDGRENLFQAAVIELGRQGIAVDQFEEGESEASYSLPEGAFVPADVDIRPRSMAVATMINRLQGNEIELSPGFQRRSGIWSDEDKSRLIESLMLQIPLPAFYFDAKDEDKWIVIDGLQRLNAFRDFAVSKKLKLTGLDYLRDFEGKSYRELPRRYIRRIQESQLTVYTVEKGTPDAVVYNIFKRVNTGGLELEPQEIRHALFQGFATKYLKELAQLPSFLNATCESIPTDRMMDREFVLRFLSFYELDIASYTGVIDDFLVSGMKHINKVYGANPAYAEEVRNLFDSVLKISSAIFGKFAFRRIPNRNRRRPINKALFTIWTVLLAKCTPEERASLEERRELLMELYIPMFAKEADFYKSLGSGKPSSVRKQFQQIESLIRRVLSCHLLPYPIESVSTQETEDGLIAVIDYNNEQATIHFPDGRTKIVSQKDVAGELLSAM